MNNPPYAFYPEMASEEILLRKIRPEDFPDIISISFYDGKQAATEAEAKEMLDQIEQDYQNGESVHWELSKEVRGRLSALVVTIVVSKITPGS